MKRLFLAIKIHGNDSFIEIFQSLSKELQADKIKWIDINNLHLTLKFFGETDESKINIINQSMQKVVSRHKAFSFYISGMGIFGSNYLPKVIWLGTKANDSLISISEQILNELASVGFERDRQNFIPHLTLGRINSINDKVRFNECIKKYNINDIQKVEVNEIILFESILQKTGPVYEVVSCYKI